MKKHAVEVTGFKVTPINIPSNELLQRNSNIPKIKNKMLLSNQIKNQKKMKDRAPT